MKNGGKIWFSFLLLSLFTKVRPIENCPPQIGCEFSDDGANFGRILSCRGDYRGAENPPEKANVAKLSICHPNSEAIDLGRLLDDFPDVGEISINRGNVSEILAKNSTKKANQNLKILRLSDLRLEHFEAGLLRRLGNLEILDLSGNRLRNLDFSSEDGGELRKLNKIYLQDNPWNCSLPLNWTLRLNPKAIKTPENVTCHGHPYPGKPVLPIAKFLNEVQTFCPEICECSMPNVVRDPETRALEPIIVVNCSDRSLDHFPAVLPPRTKSVHLENNEIEDLDALISNPIYSDVLDLYLDDNRITSVDGLEGSHWLANFRVFSLNGNRLTQIPTYALDNALQRNPNMPNAILIYLGDNPWRCDCVFTPGFQEMLRKYQAQIQDAREVKCSYVEGDDNSLLSIMELTRSSVCHLPTEYSVKALDLLNGILASLIILILGKLIYDYYHFKKTGRLPWIVTKMP